MNLAIIELLHQFAVMNSARMNVKKTVMVTVFIPPYRIPTIPLSARWRGGAMGKAFGLAISRSRVQILLEATLRNNLMQVVHTYVPLSPSSITWYRPKGGDALWLGR